MLFLPGRNILFFFQGKKHVTRNPTKHARYQKCINTPQMLYRITVVHVYCGYYLRSFKIINLDNINNYNTQNTAHKTQHTAYSTQHIVQSNLRTYTVQLKILSNRIFDDIPILHTHYTSYINYEIDYQFESEAIINHINLHPHLHPHLHLHHIHLWSLDCLNSEF